MRIAALSVTTLALVSCVQGAPIPRGAGYGPDGRAVRNHDSSTTEKIAAGIIAGVVSLGFGLGSWLCWRGRDSAPSVSTAMTSSSGGGGGGSNLLFLTQGARMGAVL